MQIIDFLLKPDTERSKFVHSTIKTMNKNTVPDGEQADFVKRQTSVSARFLVPVQGLGTDVLQIHSRRILQTVASLQPYPVSIINSDGIIIASSISELEGRAHATAADVITLSCRQSVGEITASSNMCCLSMDQCTVGAIELIGLPKRKVSLMKMVKAVADLTLANAILSGSTTASRPDSGALSVLVGVHPLDCTQLLKDLSALGFDINTAHTTIYFELSKINTISVDDGHRELILDDRQVEYSVKQFFNYLTQVFSGGQDFVLADHARRDALVLWADRSANDDMNTMRLYNICEHLNEIAEKEYCINLNAAIGTRCCKLQDYERQYEQTIKRLGSGKMMFPEKHIFWGHSVILGSLIFHLSRQNRTKLSAVLNNILASRQDDMLMQTLFTFFESNMNHSLTAQKLFIHRNSLKYRLKKIEELTGAKLTDLDSVVALRIATLCYSSLLIENEKMKM